MTQSFKFKSIFCCYFQDSRSNLDTMVHQCQSGLHQFNDSTKDSLLSEVSSLLDAIHNQNMKEVKGLEDRLYGLEQLLIGARKLLQEQDDMAQVGAGKRLLHYWPFVRGIHQDSPNKGQIMQRCGISFISLKLLNKQLNSCWFERTLC